MRGADRDDLVGVDALVRLLAEELLHALLHRRHAGHAADQDDLVDLLGAEAGVLERGAAGPVEAVEQIGARAPRASRGVSFMLRCFGPLWSAVTNGRLMSVSIAVESSHLRLLGRFLQALQRHAVLAQVDALVLLELVGQVVDDALVEVLAAEEGVAVGGLHLEDAVADLEDRDVEGAAAEVEDGDLLVLLLVEAVGERRRGRLVDDAQDVEAGDAAGVLGRLALAVVEVGRDGDDRLGDLLAEVVLGGLLHLLQDEGRDLGRAVLLAADLDPGVAVVALARSCRARSSSPSAPRDRRSGAR